VVRKKKLYELKKKMKPMWFGLKRRMELVGKSLHELETTAIKDLRRPRNTSSLPDWISRDLPIIALPAI
jgi:hypothetical protein